MAVVGNPKHCLVLSVQSRRDLQGVLRVSSSEELVTAGTAYYQQQTSDLLIQVVVLILLMQFESEESFVLSIFKTLKTEHVRFKKFPKAMPLSRKGH